MVLKYDFESLKDHIAPSEVADYLRKINYAEDGIGYTLSSTVTEDTSPSLTSSGSNFALLYIALGICVFLTYTVRSRNR